MEVPLKGNAIQLRYLLYSRNLAREGIAVDMVVLLIDDGEQDSLSTSGFFRVEIVFD